jgi:ABC-type glycerol-3-phosphate transport system substrate-binding protein
MTRIKTPRVLFGLSLAAILAACAAPPPAAAPSAPAAQVPAAAPAATEPPAAAASGEVTTWYYYDQNNTDEKANERVGNFYIAKSMKQFNEEMAGKLTWNNVPRDYNLVLDLVTGVQNGGDVPDVMQFGIADLPVYVLNNTVQDVEWAKSEAWFKDLDPKGVEACTVEGKLMCVPISESPWLTYYWTELYKDGFPKTPEALLAAGAELKKAGNYALTYWGNTAFDGEAAGRYFYQTISGFGGSYDDGAGNLRLNTPENVKAVEFMRESVKQGLSSESVFAGNFEEEEAFKQGKAGAFPTGFFIAVRYLNPLKSLGGKEFKNIEEAVNAGAIKLAPFVAPEGGKAGCALDLFGFVVPRTAKNVEGAKAYINWVMDKKNMVDWIVNAGGGFPTSISMRAEATFQTELYKQSQAVAEASNCKPWYGSLRRIPEAKKIITNAVYDLIKAKPDADIAATLAKADEEYAKLK